MSDKPHKTAVALQYDGQNAPRVTAKGEGDIAEQILQLAQEHEVPMYANADLAELLATLDLGEEIPETLYQAIAEIIAFIYSLDASDTTAEPGKIWTPKDLAKKLEARS